jgi:hypothetical protein
MLPWRCVIAAATTEHGARMDGIEPQQPRDGTTSEADVSPGRRTSRAAQAARRRSAQRQRFATVAVVGAVVVAVVVGLGLAWSALSGGGDSPASSARQAPLGTSDPSATATPGVETAAAAPPQAAAVQAAPPPAAAAEQTAGAQSVVLGWVGDTTPGSKYGNPPGKGRALFKHTRELTREPDVMVANLEGTFGNGGPSKCDGEDSSACYAFQARPENAAALDWAGIDVVNLANNHSRDYLGPGLESTRKALEKNGIGYTGLDGEATVREVNGVRVAFLGFSPYSWSPGIGDLPAAKALVATAAEDADIVVVIMHAGAEGADKTRTPQGAERAYGEFRGDSRAFSHAVIDAGADLVVGSGPHVVRGMERYRDRLIAYSLGNFAGWKNFSRRGDLALSGLLTVRLAPDGRVLDGRWHSLRIAEPGVPKPDPDNRSLALVRKLSKKDFDEPVELADDGTFSFAAEDVPAP